MDYKRESYDPPDSGVDPGYWKVHLAIEPGELEAIERVAQSVLPGEHIDIHADVDEEGDTTVTIRVYATTRDEARAEAEHLFRKIRNAAGLPPNAIRSLGHISPSWMTGSVAREIGKEAHELHRQHRHELAIIRIQTACEMHVEETLTALLAQRHPQVEPARLIRRPATLRDPASEVVP